MQIISDFRILPISLLLNNIKTSKISLYLHAKVKLNRDHRMIQLFSCYFKMQQYQKIN